VQYAFAQKSLPNLPAAHASVSPLQFQHLTIENGLSQSSIHAVFQDSRGFLWLGAQEGLNRYNGYTFTVYRSKLGDSLSLSHSWVMCLAEDRTGRLWVGTNGGGLNAYDRTTQSFRTYQAAGRPEATKTLCNNFVNALYLDRTGTLWVGTDNGLNRYNAASDDFRQFRHSDDDSHSLSGTFVYAIAEDANGTLWVGTDYGLNRYNPATQDFERVYFKPDEGSIGNEIRAIAPTPDGSLWLGSYKGLGIYTPRTERLRSFFSNASVPTSLCSDAIRCLLRDTDGMLWVGTERGLSLLANSDEYTHDEPLAEAFVNCHYSPYSAKALTSDVIRSLYQDRSGIVWIGTGTGGVNFWDKFRHKFPLYSDEANGIKASTTNAFVPSIPPSKASTSSTSALFNTFKSVRSFCEQGDRRVLWIGSDQGLTRLDRQTNTTIHFAPNAQNPHAVGQEPVWTLHRDRSGTLWAGTSGGLSKFVPAPNAATLAQSTFVTYTSSPEDSSTLSSNSIRSFVETRDGAFWIGTLNGLNFIDSSSVAVMRAAQQSSKQFLNKPTVKRFFHDERTLSSLSDNRVMALFEDSKGVLWVGTSNGLNTLDRATGRFTSYTHSTDKRSISSNWIKSIMEDAAGTLWIATASGLNRFDRATQSFTSYGLQQGLANDYIYGVVEDAQGFLWMGTNQGLAKFDKRSERFELFDVNDGLQSNEFNTNAFYKSSSGELMFGGINGFNAFFPERVVKNAMRPPLALVRVHVLDKPYSLASEPSELHTLMLSHTENFVEFEFALMDFRAPERKRYFFKLDGVDAEWKTTGARNFVTYTNLDAGEYTLHAKAINSENVESAELAIQIIIHPPFWRTWWFRAGVTFVVVMGAVGFYQWRIRSIEAQRRELERQVAERTAELRERSDALERSNEELSWANREIGRQNEELRHLNDEKNEFLGIAAHDLRNPLSRILSLADMMNVDAEEFTAGEVREFSTMISDTATRILELVKNLLNVNAIERGAVQLRIQPVNVAKMLEKVQSEYQTRAAAKAIVLDIALDIARDVSLDVTAGSTTKSVRSLAVSPLYVAADPAALEQIIDNLVSNAVKYSPVGKVVRVWAQEEQYQPRQEGASTLPTDARAVVAISIQDEGPGFSDDDKTKLFQRFARLSAKPTGGEHSTGLGLSIVKRLTEAMHGTIEFKSEQGKGTTFTVRLPRTGPQMLMQE
jgi:ligand-binding sensor domain-containing protein/signal transduction histidine kinase